MPHGETNAEGSRQNVETGAFPNSAFLMLRFEFARDRQLLLPRNWHGSHSLPSTSVHCSKGRLVVTIRLVRAYARLTTSKGSSAPDLENGT